MPELFPITPIMYAIPPGGDISTRIAPPYDVLDEGPKQALLARDPHNIVAVDLPVTPPKTVGPDEAYHEAGVLLRNWLSQGIMDAHHKPMVVGYEQVFELRGQTVRRRGLLAALGLEPFNRKGGGIFRHELTIQGGIDDRSKLMQSTRMQLSPVFGVFSDTKGVVADQLGEYFESRQPDFFGSTSHDGVQHRCWVIDDTGRIRTLQSFFQTADVFIADGHHRYTTALNYSQQHAQCQVAGRCLFMLVALQDPGMIVLPTHRMVYGLDRDFNMNKLAQYVEQHESLRLTQATYGPDQLAQLEHAVLQESGHCFGIYEPALKRTGILHAVGDDPLALLLPKRAAVWRQLDVAIAHELVIDRVLKQAFGDEHVSYRYTPDLDELRRLSDQQTGSLGLILRATPLKSVCEVSQVDELMPSKSTFFYPKVATGLVLNPLYEQ